MHIPQRLLIENQRDFILAAAKRTFAIAKANTLIAYSQPKAYEDAAVDSKPFGILYALVVEQTEGALTDAEQLAARTIIIASGVDFPMRVNPAGLVLLRTEVANSAKHVVQFLKEQSALALEAA